jgi:DNA repair ATPase RecN
LQQEKTNLETILKELDKKKPTNNIEISSINEQKQQIEEKIKLINDTIKSSANVVRQEKEIDKLKKQIAQVLSAMTGLKDQIRKNEEEAVAAVYLTTEEANAKLESIKQEIKDIIAKTAKEANISLVIDNSFAMRTPKRKEPQSMLPITLDSIDVVSAALFHSFLNYTVDKELEATCRCLPDLKTWQANIFWRGAL